MLGFKLAVRAHAWCLLSLGIGKAVRIALNNHGILELQHVDDRAGLISHVDVVPQLDPASLSDADLDHLACFQERVRNGAF